MPKSNLPITGVKVNDGELILDIYEDCVTLREKGRAVSTAVSITWGAIHQRAHWLNGASKKSTKRRHTVDRGLLQTEREAQ